MRAHFCEIHGRVLGGMQFGLLVQGLCWGAVDGADAFCKIDGRVLRGHAVWGAGAGAVLGGGAW